jgi:hypothetical protein
MRIPDLFFDTWQVSFLVRFEVLTAVTMNNAVFRDVTLLRSVLRLLVTANLVPKLVDSCYSGDGGDTYLRNACSYKSHRV